MKKLGLLLLLTILAIQMGFAAPRSYRQARAIALQKAASLGISNPNAALSKQSPGAEDVDGKAYYLFDNGGDKGFVIVSGDDRLPDVLGYATEGSLSDGEMPIQLKALLDVFEKQFADMADDDAKMESATAERKALAESSAAANVSVEPLLGNIAWYQGTPYNNLCPQIDDSKAVTGCVATAMAQVIRYYQSPTKLQNDIPGYTTTIGSLSLSEISASSTTYDYEKMLEQYESGNYSDEEANAVATLMYHCGCAVQMEYGVSESSAITRSTSHVLGAYFGYDTSTLAFVDRCDYSLAEWCSIIDHELTNNRPIIYDGRTLDNAGHAFVCDGANGNGFYHINWGWSGYCNGYFDISLLNSKDPESTTGAGEYNTGMGMTIGIKPSGDSGEAPIAKAKDLYASVNSVNLASPDRSDTGNINVNPSFRIHNFSYEAFNGWVALAVKKNTEYELISGKIDISLNAFTIQGTYYYKDVYWDFNYNFPIGTTKVFVVCGSGEDIKSICGGYGGKPYFYVTANETTATISNGYSLSAELSADVTIYNGMDNKLSLTVTNSGIQEYLDVVKVYVSDTETKPSEASSTLYLAVPADNGTTTRDVTVNPTEVGNIYVWVDDVNGNPLISAQPFTVEQSTEPVLTLVSVETNAVDWGYELNNAIYEGQKVLASKTYDDVATFRFKIKNTGGATNCKCLMQCMDISLTGIPKTLIETKRIESNATETFVISVSPNDINSRFIFGAIYLVSETNVVSSPTSSEALSELSLPIIGEDGNLTGYGYVFSQKNCSALYVPETTPLTTNPDNNSTYWATYSNQSSDTEIGVPTGRSMTLYNATVSGGHLTLTPRTGDYAHKVAKGEAVLIKTDGESVKVDNLGGVSGMLQDTNNELIATGISEEILNAGEGYVFYRLAYKNASKTDLGFYLSVVNDGTTTRDGSRIKTTPGKGYLKVEKSDATEGSASSPAAAFLLGGGGGDNTTDIECITVTENKTSEDSADDRMFNLQGQQVKKPTKGIYIKNNKKVVIK